MVDLMNLTPTKISRNLKGKFMLVYGLPKVGKTTFVSQIPKSLILSTEPGTNAIQGAYVQPILSWNDMKVAISQLKLPQLKDKFDIIGIDTADIAYDLCVKYICTNNGVEQIGDIPYGGGYDLAKKEFSSVLSDLAFMGYGIVFISHSTEKKMLDEKGEEYYQLIPALPSRAYGVINKLVDIIGYIRTITETDGTQHTNIYLRGNDRFWAGSRFKHIEPVVNFSYEDVTAAIYDAIDKQIAESNGKVSVEATTEEYNPYFDTEKNYSNFMDEAKQLWIKLAGTDAKNAETIINKVDELLGTPGKNTKISEITEDKVDILVQIIDFMKNM